MNRIIVFLSCICFSFSSFSQEDLLSFLNDDNENVLTFSTFKSTKIINLQSVEQTNKNELNFVISHRFGALNSGIENLYGLDYGSIRMSFDYGITDDITVGLARSSSYKVIDASVKGRLITQGKNDFPFTVAMYSAVFYDTLSSLWATEDMLKNDFSFTHQLMIARKVNSNLSLQISPALTSYNFLSPYPWTLLVNEKMYTLGIGGRYKVSRSVSINSEWIPIFMTNSNLIHPFKNKDFINSFSVGCDIETGGHVFQLFLTNSETMFERGFLNETLGSWKSGGVHFGFNISRPFNFN
ncbi:MAG: DUF5777 family beta-barrel protein [Flavobacteriales bacterium]|tara:strand:+ start:836 stop:1726 length:891 start_codon:yes stop_codon:yes gene_type:complete